MGQKGDVLGPTEALDGPCISARTYQGRHMDGGQPTVLKNSKVGQDLHSRENATERTETEVFKIMGHERDMDRDPVTPKPSGN